MDFPVEIGLSARFLGKFRKGRFAVEKIGGARFLSHIDKFRAKCRARLRRLLHEWGDAGGLLLALLSGSRDAIEPDVAEGFKRAGISHILALSGMHASLFLSLAGAAGKLLKRRKFAFALSFFSVSAFIWFAGMSPSLLRAFLCAAFGMAASLLLAKTSALSILAAAFLAHIAIKGEDAVQVSFLLSYGAVAGILIFQAPCKRVLTRILPRLFAVPLSASVAAQILAAPICAAVFGQLMPIGIISSVFASPLAVAFFAFGFFATLACLAIPPLAAPLGFVLRTMYFALKTTVMFFAKVPPVVL